jgi:hypothetical protein
MNLFEPINNSKMAEFCNKCTEKMWGTEIPPDINVYEVFETLEPGYVSSGYICEGCGLVAIAKNEEGKLQVMRIRHDKETGEQVTSEWEEYWGKDHFENGVS